MGTNHCFIEIFITVYDKISKKDSDHQDFIIKTIITYLSSKTIYRAFLKRINLVRGQVRVNVNLVRVKFLRGVKFFQVGVSFLLVMVNFILEGISILLRDIMF